jgi:crotonobetainyl-CoA:carnitine CoA-transferase CaiB-like acyl-CoA transferase
MNAEPLPLEGILVLDFSQFLAAPMAAMRLGDLGARVIKIERPQGGDIGRRLAFAGIVEDGDTLSFHITNRNKESYAADLKNPDDLPGVWALVAKADVIIQNFRPGIMERLGFGYDAVAAVNPGRVRQRDGVRHRGTVAGPARAGSARPVAVGASVAQWQRRGSAGARRYRAR